MKHSLLGAALIVVSACDSRPGFDASRINAEPVGAGLPLGFVLGTATAAHQIEGGNSNNWSQWEEGQFPDGSPHIRDNQRSGTAARSWDLWQDDVDMLTELKAGGYRLSLEWSRLEPVKGQWDSAAADRYRQLLQALRDRGIKPYVTLFHFTLPLWASDNGGWESPETLEAFEVFSEHCGAAFGDLVDDWVTLNEPNAFAIFGYGNGQWPPGVQDIGRSAKVYATLMHAHGRAAWALRSTDTIDADGDGTPMQVGLAHHVMLIQPSSSSPTDIALAGIFDDFANESIARAAATGRITINLPGFISIDEEAPEMKGSFDYLGINHYYRLFLRSDFSKPILAHMFVPNGRPTSDVGGDLYPEGLYRVLVRFAAYGWPLYVTENGVADSEDKVRSDFLRSHLYAVSQSIADGADVRGYFHWTLMDNFEWGEGFHARFGLYSVDYDNPDRPRTARPSAAVFREAAERLFHAL